MYNKNNNIVAVCCSQMHDRVKGDVLKTFEFSDWSDRSAAPAPHTPPSRSNTGIASQRSKHGSSVRSIVKQPIGNQDQTLQPLGELDAQCRTSAGSLGSIIQERISSESIRTADDRERRTGEEMILSEKIDGTMQSILKRLVALEQIHQHTAVSAPMVGAGLLPQWVCLLCGCIASLVVDELVLLCTEVQ